MEGGNSGNPLEMKSLAVPSVQELVSSAAPLSAVPSRYVSPQPLDAPLLLPSDALCIPVIDIHLLLSGDPSELQRLHSACHHWGFFQAVKHGVDSSMVERFKSEVKDLFNLPAEEKRKYWKTAEVRQGFGQGFVVSEEQQLDWADMFYMITNPPVLRHTGFFTSLPHPFREALECYTTEVHKLALKIIDCLGKALGQETQNYFKECFNETNQSLRLSYYPPCPEPEKVIGLSPHSDADSLTILIQANEVQGLQVKKDGHWIPVNPLPDAFIVNIGDSMEIFSNGVYPSIEHRVMVNQAKERLSIATFHNPGFDQEIAPSPSLVTAKNPARFKRIITMDYLKRYLSGKLEGKSYLDAVRIDPKLVEPTQ